MAYYSPGGSKTTVKNLDKACSQLSNLKDELVVKSGTMIYDVLNSMLLYGEGEMRDVYKKSGVEYADKVRVIHNIVEGESGWGRIYAWGDNLFFAEFGTGINLNSGSSRGWEQGYTPASWSLGADGKGYLDGNRLVLFQGWWPVKQGVPNAEERIFITAKGKIIKRLAVQGNAPVNATEAAVKKILEMTPTSLNGHFKIKAIFKK